MPRVPDPCPMAQHAHHIAERVDQTWRARYAGDETVPLSVVAALTLLGPADTQGPDPGVRLSAASAAQITQTITDAWHLFCQMRPDLAYRVLPLIEWTSTKERRDNHMHGAAAVAQTAVKAGLLELAGHAERRRRADVLGAVLTALRTRAAKGRAGQFFTPPELARLDAAMCVNGDPRPGTGFYEPAAGTGTMLLGTARVLRERGLDPASMTWAALDLDPVVAACLAVNVHTWGLGANVLIGCGEGLLDEWVPRALHERAQGIRIARAGALARLALSASNAGAAAPVPAAR